MFTYLMSTCLKKLLQSLPCINSDRVSRQDLKKLPAHRTNQIAGFEECCLLTNLEKSKKVIIIIIIIA